MGYTMPYGDLMHVIDLNMVIANQDICAAVKLAAMTIQTKTYLTLADYVRQLSLEDINLLIAMARTIPYPSPLSHIARINIMTLSEVLAIGEGHIHAGDDEARESFIMVVHAIILEDMKRRNLISIDYTLLNFENNPEALIATITELGQQYDLENPNQRP